MVLLVVDGDEPTVDGGNTASETGESTPRPEPAGRPPGEGTPSGEREAGRRTPEPAPGAEPDVEQIAARRASAAYRDYLKAIDARNGEGLCGLLAPGFERRLRPPVTRGNCARRISRSIGFEDPRGFPVWEATRLSGIESTIVGQGLSVQVTATVITAFADRAEPSVESDVAYLERVAGSYRLAKASGALWRAVGKPDVPPQVVARPQGFELSG